MIQAHSQALSQPSNQRGSKQEVESRWIKRPTLNIQSQQDRVLYVLLLQQRAVESLKRGIKVIKGMVLSKHWTANPLCNWVELLSALRYGLVDAFRTKPAFLKMELQHRAGPESSCLCLHWNVEIKGQLVMVPWQMLGMCSMRRSQSSVVSRPLGLWLSSLAGWATILSKINSAIGRLSTYFKLFLKVKAIFDALKNLQIAIYMLHAKSHYCSKVWVLYEFY